MDESTLSKEKNYNHIKIAIEYLRYHKSLVLLNVVILLAVSLSEGIGVGMIIPILQSLTGDGGSNQFIEYTKEALQLLNLDYSFLNLMIIFVFFLTLKFAFTALQQHCARVLSASLIYDLRKMAFDNLMRLPLTFYHQKKLGDLTATVQISSLNAGGMMENVVNMFMGIFFIMVYIFISCVISLKMTVIAISISLVSYVWIIPIFKDINRAGTEEKSLTDMITSFLFDKLGGIKVVKAFNNEKLHLKDFRKVILNYKKMQISIMKNKIVANLMFEPLITLVVIALVFFAVERLRMPVISLIGFFYVMRLIFPKFKTVNGQYMAIMTCLPHFSKIHEIIEKEDKIYFPEGQKNIDSMHSEIVFNDVWFKYLSDEDYILKGIHLRIPKNKTVAIVGESGIGKSTVAALLLRLYDPTKGVITINGTDIRQIEFKNLNRLFGFVDQDPYLFHDTIYNNIVYGKTDASRLEVIEASKMANAYEFIMKLPDQYNTVVGERGVKLSGGQRQRISLARSLIRDPEILILDEATSSLDSESEQLIQNSIDTLSRDKTIVIIAHRLSTIRHADKIVVIERGEIVEEGPHEELLEMNGIYKRYHSLQQK